MWWMAIAEGAKATQAGIGATTQAYNQQASNYMAEEDALLQNTAENKAIAEANLKNLIRTGYRAGIINIQRAQAKRQAQAAGVDLSAATGDVLASNSANAAAAGAVGPSVTAVAADVAVRTDMARAEQDENIRVVSENFDLQMRDLITAGLDAQRSAQVVNVRRTRTEVPGYLEILLSGGAAAASTYGQNQIRSGAWSGGGKGGASAPSGSTSNNLIG